MTEHEAFKDGLEVAQQGHRETVCPFDDDYDPFLYEAWLAGFLAHFFSQADIISFERH